jgi:hypothetical protein
MFEHMFEWLNITPFGVPVVPLVYVSVARSDGDTGYKGTNACIKYKVQI